MAVTSGRGSEEPRVLTLDEEFRLFVWALWRAGVIDGVAFKAAIGFIRQVRDEKMKISDALEECAKWE